VRQVKERFPDGFQVKIDGIEGDRRVADFNRWRPAYLESRITRRLIG
jgi:hypothetical protein